uniref:Uncharacterized protein n=1 Tax=Ixodes ricinus TaxID=34613 RepID=A0A6B0UI28_IXORI
MLEQLLMCGVLCVEVRRAFRLQRGSGEVLARGKYDAEVSMRGVIRWHTPPHQSGLLYVLGSIELMKKGSIKRANDFNGHYRRNMWKVNVEVGGFQDS